MAAEMQCLLAAWPGQVEVCDERGCFRARVWQPVSDRLKVRRGLRWMIRAVHAIELSLLVVVQLSNQAQARNVSNRYTLGERARSLEARHHRVLTV